MNSNLDTNVRNMSLKLKATKHKSKSLSYDQWVLTNHAKFIL